MLQTQCYGIQVSRYTRYKQTKKQTDKQNKQTDYYNPWPPTRLGLIIDSILTLCESLVTLLTLYTNLHSIV